MPLFRWAQHKWANMSYHEVFGDKLYIGNASSIVDMLPEGL